MSPRRRRARRRLTDFLIVALQGLAFAAVVFGFLWAIDVIFAPPG